MSGSGDGRIRHGVRVAAVHLRVNVLNELQYRSNLVIQLLQSIVQTIGGLVVIGIVYGKVDSLHGWSRAELLAAVGVYTVVGGFMRSAVQPAMSQFMDDVKDGRFDFTLLKPVDAQLMVSTRQIGIWQFSDVVIGLGIIVYAAPDLPSALGVSDIAIFLVLLLAGSVIAYCFWLSLCTAAFWVVEMPFMDGLFHYMARGAQYPITIYPLWLRFGLTIVIPLGIAITAPAEAITSHLSWWTLIAALAMTIAMVALSRTLWRRGIRRYSSASS